jgi:hypothetical protein
VTGNDGDGPSRRTSKDKGAVLGQHGRFGRSWQLRGHVTGPGFQITGLGTHLHLAERPPCGF